MSKAKAQGDGGFMGASRSVARAMRALELALDYPNGLSLAEMQRGLSIPLSSLRAIIRPLLESDYLVRQEDARFRAGPKMTQLAIRCLQGWDVIEAAGSVMEEVCRLSGEPVFLGVLEGQDVLCVHAVLPAARNPEWALGRPLGSRTPAHIAAFGRAILAFLPPEEVDALYPADPLPSAASNPKWNKAWLLASLAETRRTGVAFAEPEAVGGAFAVGAAILGHTGRPVAALSVASLSANLDRSRQFRLAEMVRAGGALASYTLGFVPLSAPVPSMAGLREAWETGSIRH